MNQLKDLWSDLTIFMLPFERLGWMLLVSLLSLQVFISERYDDVNIYMADPNDGGVHIMENTIPDVPIINDVEPMDTTYNYGNIRKNPNNRWKGAVDCKGDFVCFKTPHHAIRAMNVILNTYDNKYNVNTIEDIVNRWAPPIENNTTKLVQIISYLSGIEPHTPITKYDYENRISLIMALVKIEVGEYPDESIVAEVVYSGAPYGINI